MIKSFKLNSPLMSRDYWASVCFQNESSVGLTWFNRLVTFLVLVAIAVSVISTESLVIEQYAFEVKALEVFLGVAFIFEYLLRIWSCKSVDEFSGAWGRLRYIKSPSAIFDLIALIPVFLYFGASDAFLLRVVRLMRLARFAQLGRFSRTIKYFTLAFKSHWQELFFTFWMAFIFLILAATTLYVIEGDIQPDQFGSIPRAMWWAVATLTTVGYGDVYPVTAIGKFASAIIALVGIGTVALPAGIFAAAFSEAFSQVKNRNKV